MRQKVGTKCIKKVALASNLAQQENKWGKSLNFRAKIGSETILGHFSTLCRSLFWVFRVECFLEKRTLWSRLLVYFKCNRVVYLWMIIMTWAKTREGKLQMKIESLAHIFHSACFSSNWILNERRRMSQFSLWVQKPDFLKKHLLRRVSKQVLALSNNTVFENHSKSLIFQHFELSELCLFLILSIKNQR